MFDGYILLILVLIILLSVITIYNIACFIGVIIRSSKYKDLDDDGIKQAIQNENFTLNFWWAIIKRGIKKSGSSKEKLKKSTRIIYIINNITTNLLIKIIVLLAALLIVFYSMSYIMKAASSIFVVLADECTCFVQCSGDSADDSKSPYELVFGPTKWNNLKKIYVKYATSEEYEAFEAYTTGKEIGYWCITHINEEVVAQFKQDCLDRNIVKLDGYNVSTMTNDQLSDQFKKLMTDYKENGRGAECKVCDDYASKMVYLICGGIHQYVAPWSFQSISDETGELDLGNIVFVGDSRTIDMFYDSDDQIWGEEHDGIEIYAKHGGGFSWLEEVYAGGGIGDDTNTLVTWMGANDNGDTSQYESFYQAAMDAGLRVIICTVGPTDDNYLEEGDKTNYSNSKMTQYNDSIKDWANNNGVTVIDVYSFIESTSSIQIDQADGIHYYPRPTTEIWDYILGRIKALTGSTKPPTGGNVMGHATGRYAVQLDDGMYYWYHQGLDRCANCDEWSSRTWGTSGTEKNFNSNGCAVYSLACIVSNLYGGEVTPTELMNKFGVGTSSGTKYVTSSSSVFTGSNGIDINRFAAMAIVKNTYGLEYSSLSVGSSTTAQQIQYIDDILSKGGVVWSHWMDAECDWCANSTSKHFMGIRKSDGSNYYCFTSSSSKKKGGGRQGAIDTMNMPLSKQAVVDSLEQGGNVLIGIWNPNASAGGGGGGQGGYNLSASDTELVSWFKSDLGVSEQKAYGMLACYKAATESGLSTYETVGLLGCAMAEGSPALVQYGFSVNGYGTSSKNNPLIIDTTDKANAWINNIVKSRGCGTAQWTDTLYKGSWSYRGRTYIEYVKKYTTDTACDYKTLWSADYDMYKMELTGGYKSLVTDMPNHNSSVESITVFSMFRYEAGWGNYKNTDNIEDYSGTFRTYLDTRYKNATAVDAMFRKHAK